TEAAQLFYFSLSHSAPRVYVEGLSRIYGTGGRMSLQSYLDEHGANYRVSRHSTAYTAQELAAAEHVSGKRVIKPVIIQADGQFMMCALPACYRVDVNELKTQLMADDVRIADEETVRELFTDCEPGAEPPIGRLYGMT